VPSRFERWTQRLIASFVGRLWYDAKLHGNAPANAPTLFVGLHRNGAIDGYVHLCVLGGDILFLVAANLRRNLLTRPLAVGIPVERAKDGRDRSGNRVAIDAAAHWIAAGGQLFIYPEGTSTLGPDVLPFHIGAARIAAHAIELGMLPKLVPVGIDYVRPWVPGSQVDIVIGPAIDLETLPPDRDMRVAEIHKRIGERLLALAHRFPDEATQEAVRYAAEVSAAGDRLKRLDLLRCPAPAPLPGRPRPSLAAAMVLALGVAANPPVAAAILLMPKRFADDRNVIALWQIVPTLFLMPLWLVLSGALAAAFCGPLGLLVPLVQAGLGIAALRTAAPALPPERPSNP
jgi:1-acyl-sn-glycerol-3-phosphate acyltransferase